MRSRRLVVVVVAVAAFAVAAVFILAHFHSGGGSGVAGGGCSALVVDGLYEAYPNDTLLSVLRSLLSSHGCNVDVVVGRKAGPDVFSRLSDYDVVVLRVHGGYAVGRGGVLVGLFTGVPWSERYRGMAGEGLTAEGVPAVPPPRGPKVFLALLPKFFEERLEGKFRPGSVVVAAGCYTAMSDELARVLCGRGLGYYIGFRGNVSLSTLDAVLPRILEAVLEARASGGDVAAAVEAFNVTGLAVYKCGKLEG